MRENVYNKFYTPEKWSQCNRENIALVNDFLLEKQSQDKKQTTIDQYFNDARIICIYVLEELGNTAFYNLKRKDFRNLVLYFKNKNMSNARANRLMCVVRGMLAYAEDDEDYEEYTYNYAQKVRGLQREPSREIVFLSNDEIMFIYNKLIEKEKYQQALLCALMYDSCARRNEVAQLNRGDIAEDRVKTNTLVIAKRGKKYRPMYSSLTKEAYVLYERHRDDNTDFLWITSLNTQAKSKILYEWVVSWRPILQEMNGEYKEFNPHSWRHSAATNYEDGTHYFCQKIGRPLSMFEIQKLMNHSDLSTTQGYLKCRDEEILINIFDI